MEHRPEPADPEHSHLLFLTYFGNPWVRVKVSETEAGPKYTPVDSVHLEFRKVLDDVGIARKGTAFYAIRHTFQTIGGEAKDQVALDFLMGHAPPENDMSARYRDQRRTAPGRHRSDPPLTFGH